jgi:hypothetical protein
MLVNYATPVLGTFALDVNGTARVSGAVTIGATGASFNISYVTGGFGNINLGGTIGATPDRSIAVGGVASGLLSTAVGMSATASGGGTAIGGYQTVATGGIAISSAVGASIASGSQAIAIGSASLAYGTSATAINGIVGTSGSNSLGVAINGTVAGGIANGSIALYGYAGANQSVAIYGSTSAANEFVVGAAYDNGDMSNFAMTNVYFGSGKQRANTGGVNKTGAGFSYTINGSGAFGTDFAGGDITIAGGKGTGSGKSGDVVISTATPTTSGTTLQTLTQRLEIFGNTGNVLIQNGGTFTDAGYRLDVNGTARVSNILTMTNYVNLTTTNRFIAVDATALIGKLNGESTLIFTSGLTTDRAISVKGASGTSQVGIGLTSETFTASAVFEINATTKGFLPPRGTNTQMLAIASPATGLIFYDTTNNKLNCYDGTTWQPCW